MAMGQAHTPETRAAVLAALLAGQSVHKVAEEYKIDRKTIREWRAAANASPPPSPPKKDVGELVGGYLEALLDTLRVQAGQFGNAAWLEKQSAADLAVLHGVMADKAFRILAAAEDAGDPDEPAA